MPSPQELRRRREHAWSPSARPLPAPAPPTIPSPAPAEDILPPQPLQPAKRSQGADIGAGLVAVAFVVGIGWWLTSNIFSATPSTSTLLPTSSSVGNVAVAPTPTDSPALLMAAFQDGVKDPSYTTIQQATAKINAISSRCQGQSDAWIESGVYELQKAMIKNGQYDTLFNIADIWYSLLQPGGSGKDCASTLLMMFQTTVQPN